MSVKKEVLKKALEIVQKKGFEGLPNQTVVELVDFEGHEFPARELIEVLIKEKNWYEMPTGQHLASPKP